MDNITGYRIGWQHITPEAERLKKRFAASLDLGMPTLLRTIANKQEENNAQDEATVEALLLLLAAYAERKRGHDL